MSEGNEMKSGALEESMFFIFAVFALSESVLIYFVVAFIEKLFVYLEILRGIS